jgi:hypothetical protein
MTRYATLRTWAGVLKIIGVVGMVLAVFGVISAAIAAEGFWQTMGAVFLGGPVVLLLASWPIALGQALGAIADIGDSVVGQTSRLPS